MTLADIAADIEVTAEQRDRGVALVDDTDADLPTRLAAFENDLPCDADAAAAVLERHVSGSSIGESARVAGIAPITAAKVLYLLGREGVNPLGPQAREIVRDWLDAELSRNDAKTLIRASEPEFALAAFIETHDPLDGVQEAIEGVLSPSAATVAKRDHLAETMSDLGDLR